MYPYKVILVLTIKFFILTKCSEITNEELLDCLLAGIKHGSKCDLLEDSREKNERKHQQKSVLVKIRVPHKSDFNSVPLKNAFYKPLYRVHKHASETVKNDRDVQYYSSNTHRLKKSVKNENANDKQLKRQIKRFLGILNQRLNNNKINYLLKKRNYYRSRNERKPSHPPVIMVLDNGKGDFMKKSISKVMLGPVITREGEDEFGEGQLPVDFDTVDTVTAKPLHTYHFWNYWTYDKPVQQDRCPTPLVEYHGMCIHNPPH